MWLPLDSQAAKSSCFTFDMATTLQNINRLIKENLKHYKSKYGVESVGIGIKSDAVKSLYPDHTVVRNVGELSGAAFGMLTTILFRDKG